MKTTFFILLSLVLVSCAKPPPPGFKPWDTSAETKSVSPAAPPSSTVVESGHAAETTTATHAAQSTTVGPATTSVTHAEATTEVVVAPATTIHTTTPATAAPATVTPAATSSGTSTNGGAVSPYARTAQPAVPAITGPPATPGTLAPPTLGATAVPGAAASPTFVPNGDEIVPAAMIDFRNTPLDQVLQVYGEFVNRTILRPAALPTPQVTLTISPKNPLTRSELIQALDAVLALNGIALFNIGDKFVKVVPQAQVNTEGAPNDPREYWKLPDLGQYVTHVVQLKYLKPSETVQALQPFSKLNSILPIDTSGILVIRDYTENVKRMLEMIDRIDIAVPSEFISEVIPIKYAKAAEIADALNSLSGGGGGGGTSIGRQSSGTTRGATPGNTARPGQAGYTGNPNSPMTPGGLGAGGAPGAAGGGSFTDRLQQIIRRASTSGDLEILGKTKMIADERSNSLLIFATRADMDMIKNIVSKLDVVLSQVLIETVIMDVQMNNTLNYGVSAVQHPTKVGNKGTVGGSSVNGNGSLSALNDFFSTVGTNALSTGLNYFGKYNGSLDVAVQALASDSRVDVIQKPRILTSHATPGSIFVGGTIPYVTSTYYGGGFGGSPSSQYQQLQVGIGLTVTPYINPDGLVVMQIDETIDELSDQVTAIVGVGNVPNTVSRKLSAEVAVRDGDTIILGGFIRNSVSKGNSGVPLLKDIPLLGVLFSAKSDAKERKELLVLMRPTVLKTPEVAALATTQEKKRLPGVREAEEEINEIERGYDRRDAQRHAAARKNQMTTTDEHKASEAEPAPVTPPVNP